MRTVLIIAATLLAAGLWIVLFEIKTCACGNQQSLANRAVTTMRDQARAFVAKHATHNRPSR